MGRDISLYAFSDGAASFPLPAPPAALASPEPDTMHHAAREGIRTTQGRSGSMNAGLQIFNQYSLSIAIYASKLNKIIIMFDIKNEKM